MAFAENGPMPDVGAHQADPPRVVTLTELQAWMISYAVRLQADLERDVTAEPS
jgi:hypothetical protein